MTEFITSHEGPVASVSCTRPEDDDLSGAVCDVLLVDGREAVGVVDLEGRSGAYFVKSAPQQIEG